MVIVVYSFLMVPDGRSTSLSISTMLML